MFKVDDKVRVVNDRDNWLATDQSDDTILTVVANYNNVFNDKNERIAVMLDTVNKWSEDFELVFSPSMAEPAFKVEPQFIVDGTQVFINKACIENEATIRSDNDHLDQWRLNVNGGFVSGFGLGVVGEEPSERVISKEAHDDMVDAINHVKLNGFPKLGVYRPNLEDRKVGKVRVELVDDGFPLALREVAKVMTWAQTAKGYKDHDWQNLPNAEISLAAAASRHRTDHIKQRVVDALPIKECIDHESELLHKAHEAFGVLAQLELMLRGVFDNDRTSD